MKNKVYISKVNRYLHLDRKTKKRIIEGLQTEIQLALDNGESIDDILNQMGSAKDVADDYNKSYRSDPEYVAQRRYSILKRTALIAFIVAVAFFGVSLIGQTIFMNSDNVSQIGGISGPANVVKTESVISPLRWIDFIGKITFIPMVVFVFSTLYCFIVKIKKRKGG